MNVSWLSSKVRGLAARAVEVMSAGSFGSSVEEFHHHYQTLLLSLHHSDRPLAESDARQTLSSLVALLSTATSEDQESVVQYFLEKEVVHTLVSRFGGRDRESLALLLQFVTALLTSMPLLLLLPERQIHAPIRQLLLSAVSSHSSLYIHKSCVALLLALWQKIQQDPVQLEFFFSTSQTEDMPLFSALLPHMFEANKLIGQQARHALVIAVSTPDDAFLSYLLTFTPFCNEIVSGLIQAFEALPKTLFINNNNDNSDDNETNKQRLAIQQAFKDLATRIRFCSTLTMAGRVAVKDGGNSIAEELLRIFKKRFVEEILAQSLYATSESQARATTVYVTFLVETLSDHTTSSPILSCLCQFLVGNNDSTQKNELVHRINSLSESLSIATMELFSSLLALNDKWVTHSLLQIDFYNDSQVDEKDDLTVNSSTIENRGENEEEEVVSEEIPNLFLAQVPGDPLLHFSKSFPDSSLYKALSDLECSTIFKDKPSFLGYLVDAEYSAAVRLAAYSTYKWSHTMKGIDYPDEKTCNSYNLFFQFSPLFCSTGSIDTEASSKKSQTVNGIKKLTRPQNNSNSFLSVIWGRLERLLDHSYNENLVFSGLLSLLAQCPDSVVDYVLFAACSDVTTPVDNETTATILGNSMIDVLKVVWSEARKRLCRLPDGERLLQKLRAKMHINSIGRTDIKPEDFLAPESDIMSNRNSHQNNFVQTYILLEEFIVEFLTILHAKWKLQNMPLEPEGFYLSAHGAEKTIDEIEKASVITQDDMNSINASDVNDCSGTKIESVEMKEKAVDVALKEAEIQMEAILHSTNT